MIAIIDYGLGNIRAFANVYKNSNIPYKIVGKADDLAGATKIILPGVGAFDHAMELLQKSGMREVLDDLVLKRNIPVLGICVGMQILARRSEEGKLYGLGWIDGEVKKFDCSIFAHSTYLPHMGWNEVNIIQPNDLFKGLNSGSRFYFLHSYFFDCNRKENIIAQTNYGTQFCCVLNAGNIYGVQFHPEKSHKNGIQLLKNFALL
jgi:imidazole glycerol-phosphate synthase subunit HisH